MFDIDPSSLIGAVRCDSKTLLEVTDRVLIFISEVRNIHPSIEGSREEVKSLHGTLDTINGHLAGISITNATAKVENTGGLWPAAYKLIHDCKLTIHELYDCLAGFKSENPEGAHPKAVPKSHLGSLSPTATSDDLSVKIETLVGTISKLKVSQKSRIGGFTLEHIRLDSPSSLASLLEAAQQVALDANSVLVQKENGVEFGKSLNHGTQSRIEEWIEIDASENTSVREWEGQHPTGNHSSTTVTQMTPTRSTVAEQTELDDHYSDGGDDLEVEVVNSSLNIADAEFDKGDYIAAELWYGKAVGLAQRLSTHQQNALGLADLEISTSLKLADAKFEKRNYQAAELGYRHTLNLAQHPSSDRRNNLELGDLAEVSLRLAICCFHLQKFTEAETSLQKVLTLPIVSRQDSILSLDAAYLQVEIHLSTQSLKAAEKECKKVLAGRRKILGKLHKSYLESVGLLSIIMEAEHDAISARMYSELVENGMLDTLKKPQETTKASVSDVNATKDVAKESLVSGLRGISPIDVLLGMREINERLVNGREGPFDMTALLYRAVEEGIEPAVRLLLTACSPNSYIPFLPQLQFEDHSPDQLFIPQFQFEYQSGNEPKPKPANPWSSGVRRFPEHGVLLYVAAIKGHIGITEILLDAGFDVNTQDNSGATPLHYLFHTPVESQARIQNVNVEVVKLLLERGANGHIADQSGQVPEMYHPINGVEHIKTYHSFILEKGLDSSEYQKQREANTWRAIELGSKAVLEVLLDFGVSPYLKDVDGSTISGLAYRNAYKAKNYQVGDATGVHKLLLSRIEIEERAAKQAEWKAAREARAAK